jgi:hypothetical protein
MRPVGAHYNALGLIVIPGQIINRCPGDCSVVFEDRGITCTEQVQASAHVESVLESSGCNARGIRGSDISADSFMEPVSLVGSLEMHPAAENGFISPVRESMQKGGVVAGQEVRVIEYAVVRGQVTGEHA